VWVGIGEVGPGCLDRMRKSGGKPRLLNPELNIVERYGLVESLPGKTEAATVKSQGREGGFTPALAASQKPVEVYENQV
jgi:hypothetical protein